MQCKACQAENADGQRFCGQCAAPLAEPVTAPAPLPSNKPPEVADGGNKALKVIVAAVAVILLVFFLNTDTTSKREGSDDSLIDVSRDSVVTVSTPCAGEEIDAYRAYEAVTKGDFAALEGLVDRGKFITLETDVQVHEYAVKGKLSRVRPTSGRHIGEHCWVATGMLRAR